LGLGKALRRSPGHGFAGAGALRWRGKLQADVFVLDEAGRSVESYAVCDEDRFGIAEAEGFEALQGLEQGVYDGEFKFLISSLHFNGVYLQLEEFFQLFNDAPVIQIKHPELAKGHQIFKNLYRSFNKQAASHWEKREIVRLLNYLIALFQITMSFRSSSLDFSSLLSQLLNYLWLASTNSTISN